MTAITRGSACPGRAAGSTRSTGATRKARRARTTYGSCARTSVAAGAAAPAVARRARRAAGPRTGSRRTTGPSRTSCAPESTGDSIGTCVGAGIAAEATRATGTARSADATGTAANH